MATKQSRAKTLKGGKQGIKNLTSKQASGVKGGRRLTTSGRLLAGTTAATMNESMAVTVESAARRKR